jgi:hypothetical protein
MNQKDERPEVYIVDDPDVIIEDDGITILHRTGETQEQYIARCIAVNPPLTEEQREAIRALGRTGTQP